eukprot:SAG25_NODE_42_length_19413_cov_107.539609_9_plen_188_part_00
MDVTGLTYETINRWVYERGVMHIPRAFQPSIESSRLNQTSARRAEQEVLCTPSEQAVAAVLAVLSSNGFPQSFEAILTKVMSDDSINLLLDHTALQKAMPKKTQTYFAMNTTSTKNSAQLFICELFSFDTERLRNGLKGLQTAVDGFETNAGMPRTFGDPLPGVLTIRAFFRCNSRAEPGPLRRGKQ